MMKSINRYIINLGSILLFSGLFFGGPQTASALSIEDEESLGRKFLAHVRQYYDFVDDDFANEYINELGKYLIKPLKTRHFPFNFYIIKNSELNAFAGPGGHIFIFTGLIEAMDRIDELAAVICHEIGHVSSRHLSDRIKKSKTIGLATLAGILVGSLLGGEVAGAVITGSVAAGIQKQLSYSRNDERQADQLGFKYTSEAGFESSALKSSLEKLQRRQLGMENIPAYLLTHPGGPERMSNIESMLASYPPSSKREETARFSSIYPCFKTILRARYLEAHDAERSFNDDLNKDPDSPLAHFGLGIVLKEMSEYPEAIGHFQKALKELSETLPVLRYLGETYQLNGQDQEAIKTFEKALKINDEDKSSLFLLAASYRNQNEYSRAVSIYERLVSMEPVKDEVFYNLGVSLGRQNRLGLAHYNFGIYFQRLEKKQKADFHFQKAKELSGNDSFLKKRIRKAMEDMKKKKPAPHRPAP
ncbi:M48 family metalloprotease [Thermodesulfobacteriota bacterium]